MAGKILIADALATNRIVLKARLASTQHEILQASGAAETLALARQDRPAAILTAADLPGLPATGLCRALRADPLTRDIPLLLIAATPDAGLRLEALQAGAAEVLARPVDEALLQARLRSLLRERQALDQQALREATAQALGFRDGAADFSGPGLVGLVSQRPDEALRWKRRLQPVTADRLLVIDRDAALTPRDVGASPDVFILASDARQPSDALRLLAELRARPATRHAVICLALPAGAGEAAAMALDLGAGDVLDMEAPVDEIILRVRRQVLARRRAERVRNALTDGARLALIDPLTGLHNRRYGLPHLARIAERAQDSGKGFAVLLADIDRFKAVNDTLGHAAGDLVLAEVARRLCDGLRPGDLAARIGGEEFLIVLADCTGASARAAAERLRRGVGSRPVSLRDGASVTVTLSIGLSLGGAHAPGGADPEALLAQADRALMAAKAEGRDQVTVYQSAA